METSGCKSRLIQGNPSLRCPCRQRSEATILSYPPGILAESAETLHLLSSRHSEGKFSSRACPERSRRIKRKSDSPGNRSQIVTALSLVRAQEGESL